MKHKQKLQSRLWLVAAIAFIFWVTGSGFHHNLSAGSEETYRGLKTFSDVIELVEKNYVDPVDTKDLIEKAIQGMVSSLDPHSALLPPDAYVKSLERQGSDNSILRVKLAQKSYRSSGEHG